MDNTAQYSTIYRSVRKHLIDNLYTTQNIEVSFDRNLMIPYTYDKELTRWVSVLLKDSFPDQLFEQDLEIYCLTRKDPEGINRANLIDSVFDVFIDNDGNKLSMPLYAADFVTEIGYALPYIRVAQNNIPLEDETTYTLLRVILRWAAKL